MSERCSRTQCDAPAAARVAFDALTGFVWIDRYDADGPLDVSARGAGALCARHADRLVPPRGWAVQDRRGRDLQLWSERPGAVPAAQAHPTRTANPRRLVVVEQPLPFETASAVEAHGSVRERGTGSVPERGTGSVPERGTGSVPERVAVIEPQRVEHSAEIDQILDAPQSRLLSRAFNAARVRHPR